MRVASGQKIPELGINVEGEGEGGEEEGDGDKNMLSPTSEGGEAATGAPPSSAEVDIADRAAAMLEGLQGGSSINKDGSLSVRRRRESADTERQRRRNRRQQASSARTEDGELMSPIIQEEGDEGEGEEKEGRVNIIPPSPEGKGRELPTPPPE